MSWKQTRNLLRSSSFRFAMLTVGVIWLSTSLVLVAIYFRLDNAIWKNISQHMLERSSYLLSVAEANPMLDASELLDIYEHRGRLQVGRVHANGRGRLNRAGGGSSMMSPSFGLSSPPNAMLSQNMSVTDEEGELTLTHVITLPNGEPLALSQNISYLSDLQVSLWQSLLFGLGITLIISIAGSLVLTFRSLVRIQSINTACRTIIDGDFNYRIPYLKPERGPFDDYDEMAFNINRMLDEINLLMIRIRQVSDNVAHDLKSPLARLRTRLESIAQTQPGEAIDLCVSEVDRLLSMIKSLLGIARVESRSRSEFETLSLSALFSDLAEMYVPVFEEKQITLSVEPVVCEVQGDRHLLMQAFSNLLDNAYQYSPQNSTVRFVAAIAQTENERGVELVLQDQGPGMAEANLAQAFDRFYREENARNTQGFGLGLSLVKAIVTLHNGTISLENHDGLRVTIWLPARLTVLESSTDTA